MTEGDVSPVGLTASSIVCCGLGTCNSETLRAGCVLTQPSAGCHRGSCSLWRDSLHQPHQSTFKHVDARHAIA